MNLTKNKIITSLLILSFIGFLNATYLTILHYQNAFPPCTIAGCEKVLTSEYASLLGIPIALIGSLYFMSLAVVLLLKLTGNKNKLLNKFFILQVLSGFALSLAFVYIQAVLLKQFCQYCLLSETVSTLILILTFLQLRLTNKEK